VNCLVNIFVFGLMIFAQNAIAQTWELYAKGESALFYLDTETIKENDGFLYYWSMADMFEPMGGNLSIKSYEKVDCELERRQRLAYVFYKQSMGLGEAEYQDSLDKEWAYMVPGTIEQSGALFACSFKD